MARPDRQRNDPRNDKNHSKIAFVEEQKRLKAVPELGGNAVLPQIAIVRKNNIVMYRQNRYCMPKGTYRPGRKARIETDEVAGILRFFDCATGEALEELPLTQGTGKCIRNSHPDRDRTTKYTELIEEVKTGFSGNEAAQTFVAQMMEQKPRYVRDQLSMVAKLQGKFTKEELLQAVTYCVERALFTATDLRDTLEYFAVKQEFPIAAKLALSLKYSLVTAQERPLSAYAALAEGGGTQ